MKRLLLVIPDDLRRTVLAALAAAEGVDVIATSGSLQALTQLERTSPDLILCDDQPGDLSAQEFYEIVRSELGTSSTPLLLITDQPLSWLDPLCDLSASHARTSLELLQLLGASFNHDPFGLSAPLPVPNDAQMSGTLERMSLFDLFASLNQARRTGRLVLKIGSYQALLYLLHGEIRHAEYKGQFGSEALIHTLSAAELAPTSTFNLTVAPDSLFQQLPTTLPMPTSRLLLEMAVRLDHLRMESAYSGSGLLTASSGD